MMKQIAFVSAGLIIFMLSTCSSARKASLTGSTIPMVRDNIANAETINLIKIFRTDTLSLKQAITLALVYNQDIQIYKSEIAARQAGILQNSLLPNPELAIELENFAGSGLLSSFKNSETTIGIGQLIELGGKRGKRMEIAGQKSDLALRRYEMKRLEIITRVRKKYLQLLAAQKKTELDAKILEIERQFKLNIDKRVEAGRISAAESARARVELSIAELALNRNSRELSNLKRQISALWAPQSVDFKAVSGNLNFTASIPEIDNLLMVIDSIPLIIEQNTIIKRQRAESLLAEAMAIPDPHISVGYRYFNESDDRAFVTGISVPLPVFDRNQGGREEAKLLEKQSEQQLQSLKINLNIELSNRLAIIKNINSEIIMMENIIIPEAQKAYDIIYQNYLSGKFAMIDVLDAQRRLFDTRRRHLDALAEINLQVVELEGLIGRSLETL